MSEPETTAGRGIGCAIMLLLGLGIAAIVYFGTREPPPDVAPPPPLAVDTGPPRLTFRRLQEEVFSGEVGGWDGEQVQMHGRVMRYEPPREDAPHGFVIVHDPGDNAWAARCNFGARAGNPAFAPGRLVSLTCTVGITPLGGMLEDCFVGRD